MNSAKNIAHTLFNKWGDKEEEKKSDSHDVQPSFLSNLVAKAYLSATKEFQRVFIYGQKIHMMHKGRPKEMFVYLDNKTETLLWISSKTKAFLLDLYFTTAMFKKLTIPQNDSWIEKYYFSLCQLEEEVIFVFQTEAQNIKYFNLFTVYINDLKKKYPNYTLYFSNIKKLHAMNSTKNGTNSITYSEILDISSKLGLENKKQNEEILDMCLKYNNAEHRKKDIPQKCFDDYFQVQFCNRKLQPIFEEYSKEKINSVKNDPRAILKKVMSPDEFADFLRNSQKEGEKEIAAIMDKYRGELSFFNFCIYLYDSELNNACRIEETPQNFPLKDYFCYSSHNTYLSGNQLTSDSQVERYAQDLENGIKCVEIDIHNDSNGKPIVNHAFKGIGLCKPIQFQDVIKVIRTYSQKTELEEKNHYPIILSLQNHANYENRQFMLDSMAKHFAGKLYMIDGLDQTFPTLSYLKGKILIKTNSTEQELRLFKKNSVAKKLSITDSNQLFFGGEHKKFRNEKLQNKFVQFSKFKDRMISQKSSFNARIDRKQQILALVSEMTKITSIFKSTGGVKAKDLSQFGCTSLTFSSVSSSDPQKIINYTKTSWLRTYPHGTEINSNNYDPAPMLAVGAQIIALNTQTKDYYAWMLQSYFCGGYAKNLSQRGYVLKPAKLRAPELFDSKTKQNYILNIEVIESSGFYVAMKFFGLAQDNAKNVFSKNEFYYSNPDQSFIMFDIGDKYRNCLAVRWILEGYRILEGKDKNNYMDCGKRILIKITKKMG